MSKDYEVGYGKPPKRTQFKKGQSGNPRGRPRGSHNFSTDAKTVLTKMVTVVVDGKRKRVSAQMANLMRLMDKALSGDAKAMAQVQLLSERYNDEPDPVASDDFSSTDEDILDAFLKKQNDIPSAAHQAEALPETTEDDKADDDDWLK